MKKLLGIFAAALIMSSAVAFATDGVGVFGTSYSTPLTDGSLTYAATGVGAGVNFTVKLSANVKMALQANSGTSYLAATHHSSGNKAYATSSGDSQIFMQEKTVAAGVTTVPTPPTVASIDWAGWTAVK